MKKHQFVSQLALIMKQSQIPIGKHDLDKDKAHFLEKNSERSNRSSAGLESRKVATKSPKYQLSKKPCSFQMYD